MAKRTTPKPESGSSSEYGSSSESGSSSEFEPASESGAPLDSPSIDPPSTDTADAVPPAAGDLLMSQPEPEPTPAVDPPARDVIAQPEAVVDPSSEPAPEKPVPETRSVPPASRSGGFVGTALGGVVAAAAGYALAIYAPIPALMPAQAPSYDAQAADAALTDRIATLEAAPTADAMFAERMAALESRPQPDMPDLAAVTDTLAALQDRIAALEQRPAMTADGAAPSPELNATVAALAAQVAALEASNSDAAAGIEALAAEAQARLAEAEAQAAALTTQAEETARKARTSAAVGRIMAALDSGTPFASVLPDLDGAEVPAALTAVAETGLPSRAALEAAFAPAARQALEESLQANMGSTWSDRMGSFLQSTTGARSLTPREGGHPDAVLSRAEAAVRAGDVSQALTELEGLPPEGLAAMSDWIALARQRLDAMTAAATLAAAVEG